MRWIIIYASIIHILLGILLFISPSIFVITSIKALVFINNKTILSVLFLLVGIFSLISEKFKEPFRTLFLFPQQLILLMSSFGALICILQGQYGDGVIRPKIFILADQFPGILLSIFHSIALITILFTSEYDKLKHKFNMK